MNPLRRRLVQRALREGWVVRRQRNHLILTAPNGAIVTLASSPGGGRVERNELALMRRNGLEVPPR